jgi:AI-2 transport protein TqsA
VDLAASAGFHTHRAPHSPDAVTLHPNFLRLLNVSGLEVRCPPWLSRLTQQAAPGDVANVTTNSPAATTKNGRGPVISTPRGVVALIAVTAALVGALALKQFAWLVGPILLALVIVTLTHPVHVWLQRHRVPHLIALLALVLCIYGLVIVLVAIVAFSIARLAAILPGYADSATAIIQALNGRLAALGLGTSQLQAVAAGLDLRRVITVVTTMLRRLISFGASLVFFLSLLLFIAIDSAAISSRLAMLSSQRPGLAQALRTFARDTRRFLAVTGIFGLLTGFADTLLLWWLGIPLPVLWGLLAAVCNFIPYVGFVIGVIPPALLALLDFGWETMLLVIIVYIILNSLLTSLIAPRYMGDAIGVSTPVTVISVVFWGWVLGPLGAILSMPLTSLLKVLLIDSDPRAGWAAALVGSPRSMGADPDARRNLKQEDLRSRPEIKLGGC